MIKSFRDISLLDGKPTFDEPLHVGRPNIGNRRRLMERINDILDRKWLTNNGPFVQEFEREAAGLLGVKHCIAMCNGTVALEITSRALGLKGEVIVPSMTFIATAHSLRWQEITPVFCDVEPDTYNIDPCRLEEMITPRTTGIIGVHLWGRPCNVEVLTEIARRHNLKLMFDAAHAFGCSYKGEMIGNFGDAEVFSFHATKFLNTFEGGAVATNDDALASRIRLMKNFGFAGTDKVIYIGTNGKMNEVSAAMGLTGLDDMEEFVSVNHRNYKQYQRELEEIPGIKLLSYDESERCNYQYIIVEVDERTSGINRDQLVEILHGENVLARRYFYPGCHRMEPYASDNPHAGIMLPETERLANRVMSLPTGTAIETEDISKICEIIRFVVSNSWDVMEKLAHLKSMKEGVQCPSTI